MRNPLALLTLVAALGSPQERPENFSSAVAVLVAALNDILAKPNAKSVTSLFTSDGDLRIGGSVVGIGPTAITAALLRDRKIWSEVTPPHLEAKTVRMLASDVALVDATSVQYGSTIIKRTAPVLLILKRQDLDWRVVSMRIVADPATAHLPVLHPELR